MRYRLIWLVPDPFLGGRVLLGALCEGGKLVRAELGRGKQPLARLAWEVLEDGADFEVLPQALETLLELGPVREAPSASGSGGGERWLEALLAQPEPETAGPARSPYRATFGRRFFETWQVSEHVRATFRPDTDWDGRLAPLSPYGEVSHWVPGADALLLLEPVVPRAQLTEDLRDLAKLFAAYRSALRAQEHPVRLVAYLLPGATEAQRQEVTNALVDADEIVDTEDEDQRTLLLREVRELARTALSPMQQELFAGR